MDRRAFLKSVAGAGALSAAGTLATPAISQRAAARALRFVPQADLANFDPIWGTQYVVRNASAMVWDTLYGFDERFDGLREGGFFGVLRDTFIGVRRQHSQHFSAVYRTELCVPCAYGKLVFAGRASVTKVFDEFNAERFHWVPALSLSG